MFYLKGRKSRHTLQKTHCVETYRTQHDSQIIRHMHVFTPLVTVDGCTTHHSPLHCIAVSLVVFLGPYLVLLCPFSHSLTESESKLTFSLKGRGSSPAQCVSP